MSKQSLAVSLSHLIPFSQPKASLEQYSTPSEIAADVLWQASLLGDIKDKQVADLGAGTGILGIGALRLGAAQVDFVEVDDAVLPVLKANLAEETAYTLLHASVETYQQSVDTVFMNPPFGVQQKHADRAFLHTAFRVASCLYVLEKEASKAFIHQQANQAGFTITHEWTYPFTLPKTQAFHAKPKKTIRVCCFRLSKPYKT